MMLKDKVILITGSTTGIGAGIARLAIEQGARVMVHGRDKTRAEAMVAELGEHAHSVTAALDAPDTPEKLVKATVEAFGRIDGLVNNAGIYPRTSIAEVDEAHYERVMAINTKAPLFIAKQAIQQFRAQGSTGSIVNIGSINAYCGQSNLLVYSMSKGALTTMTRNLAEQVTSDGIRVNHLNVGWTLTETEEETQRKEGKADGWESRIPKVYAPSGKLLRPETVAPHVIFWLSDFSAPVSGQVYEVEQYTVIGRNLINHATIE